MQKYTHTVILIHRMTSQDDWWSFSLQIEMFSIVTFKFPDWIVLICSRTYRWWSSCKVMRVVSYRLPWSPLPLASLSSLPFCQRENCSWGHQVILHKIWIFCCLNPTLTSVDSVSVSAESAVDVSVWCGWCDVFSIICQQFEYWHHDTVRHPDWGSHIQAVTE